MSDLTELIKRELNLAMPVRRDVLFDTSGDTKMDGDHPESLRAVATRLEVMRVALEYPTKKDFATALGISPQTLNHYLRGNADLPIAIRQKLWAMGAHPGWLLHGEDGGLTVEFKKKVDSAMLVMGLTGTSRARGGFDY